jgi:hypothetical protein
VIDGWGVKKRGWALGESQVMGLGELRGKSGLCTAIVSK